MQVNDERNWAADAMLIRRHYWYVDPSTLTPFQFFQHLASIDRRFFGPIVHHARIPK